MGFVVLFHFMLEMGASGVAAPVPDSLCICDLSFTPMGFDSVSFAPVNDLEIDFSPPCDC